MQTQRVEENFMKHETTRLVTKSSKRNLFLDPVLN